jgi:hypothetical protein
LNGRRAQRNLLLPELQRKANGRYRDGGGIDGECHALRSETPARCQISEAEQICDFDAQRRWRREMETVAPVWTTNMDKWLKAALDYIPGWIALQMRLGDQPGCVIAIAHKGRIVLEQAFGLADLGSGEKMTPRHRFRIASQELDRRWRHEAARTGPAETRRSRRRACQRPQS